MIRLFLIEWKKTFYNRGTRIFLILYFLMIVAMGLILPNFHPNINGIAVDFIKMKALEYPVIWHNIAWLMGFGKFFLAVILINNISNEYSFGTVKQNLIDGFSKGEFFLSKLLLAFLLSLFSTFILIGIVVILGSLYSENQHAFGGFAFAFGLLIEVFGYLVMAMFLTFLLRKSTFAILLLVVLSFGETMVKGIEYLVRYSALENAPEQLKLWSTYLPFEVNSSVVDYPSVDIGKFLMTGEFFIPKPFDWAICSVAIVYCILFIALSYWLFKKRDV
ncbi:ABC transporter permease subunit [Vaginella massiliensis]|uniref:ABC transporter permease subunit n=1 Tax=Vaginella massiliensis TaxID=1816680 RepID=UPI003751856D